MIHQLPENAQAGDNYTTTAGITYTYDGVKWRGTMMQAASNPSTEVTYGETGPQGEQGVKGDTGEPGPIGPAGPKGDTGATGPAGPTGLPGSNGPQGATGTPGPQGSQGPQGPVGPAGAQGLQGATGIGIRGFASGYVNAGSFVTLDNIKVTVPTSGNRGLSMAAVSGTFSCSIAGHFAYSYSGPGGTATAYPGPTYSTTPSTSFFGWNFGNAGDTSIYYINDYNNRLFYRITLMIGAGYNNNFISIERLSDGIAPPRALGAMPPPA